MKTIYANNVPDAWHKCLLALPNMTVPRPSRNGPTFECAEPVATVYEKPTQRVLLDPRRDANPFFHLFESLWMLAGRDDVAYPSRYASRIGTYSDDGVRFHAAYGHRWRRHFGVDQLTSIAALIRGDYDTRRAVIGMWDPRADVIEPGSKAKDLPCNMVITFNARPTPEGNRRLHMTVHNRSNDVVWGAYGANVVHMSILQEWMAAATGCEVGPYVQVSDSWHAYEETWKTLGGGVTESGEPLARYVGPLENDPYYRGVQGDELPARRVPLVRRPTPERAERFLEACQEFVGDASDDSLRSLYEEQAFINEVAAPMRAVWDSYKAIKLEEAATLTATVMDDAWARAAREWLLRRMAKRAGAAAAGAAR